MSEFAIKSSRIVTPDGVVAGAVVIRNGVIHDITTDASENLFLIDVGNKVVMPGVIDPHVHINEPGRTDWEGFETATKAAIAGGITMVVDMPLNSSPVTTTVAALEEKLAAAVSKISTNVGFWGGIVPGNADQIEPLIKNGVLGFKAFLTHSGIDEFPNATEEDLRKAMPIIAKHKLPLLVHCEITDSRKGFDKLSLTNDQKQETRNQQSYQQYLASRPKEWEDQAIALMIRLCEEFECPVHIVHLSSANSIDQIARAKQKGLPITVETGQHYLYFNAEDIPDANTAFKCAPPIREKANNDLLWQALKDGIIDLVATDHSPAPPDIKELETGDFTKAWGGISSIQFALPVLWTAAKKRGCTIIDLSRWLCEKPALLAGMNKKGKIAEGYDADIIVLDDEASFTVTEDMILHRHKVTPYFGEQLYGVLEQTYLKGELVYDKGRFELNKGEIVVREW